MRILPTSASGAISRWIIPLAYLAAAAGKGRMDAACRLQHGNLSGGRAITCGSRRE